MDGSVREHRRVRALFISDVHLGMRPTRIGLLLDFLALARRRHDLSRRRHPRWLAARQGLALAARVQRLRAGACSTRPRPAREIVYLPGNHDEFLREYLGTYFGEIEFVDRTVHTTAQGKTYLVIHGDQFDVVVRARQVARACRRLGLSLRAAHQPRDQLGAPAARVLLLVAELVGEAEGQERGERDRPLRGGAVARGAASPASTA